MTQPVFSYRGIMYDVSRGKIPKLETLQSHILKLKEHGLNVVMLYIESVFDSKAFSPVFCGRTPITSSYLRSLNAFCQKHGILLAPILQSFGHQGHLLALPEFSHLAEIPDSKGGSNNFAPTVPEVYERLERWYGEILPLCSSPWLHVGCDEVYTLGKGRTRSWVKKKGYARVFADHILRLNEIAQKFGKTLMMWADVFIHYPEIADMLPKNIVAINWGYEPRDSVFEDENPSIAGHLWLAQKGFATWAAGSVGGFGFFPLFERLEKNTLAWIEEARPACSEGFLITEWGDEGHGSTSSSVFLGQAYGLHAAAEGWETVRSFLPKFADRYLGGSSASWTQGIEGLSGAGWKHLRKCCRCAGSKGKFYGDPIYDFLSADFRKPGFMSHRVAVLSDMEMAQCQKQIRRAREGLASSPAGNKFGRQLLSDYGHTASRMITALRRGELWLHWMWRSGSPYDTRENLQNRRRLEIYLRNSDLDLAWWEKVWRRDNLETELPRFLKELRTAQESIRESIP